MESKQLERNIISAVLADQEKLDGFIANTENEYFTDELCKNIRKYLAKKYMKDGEFSITKIAMKYDVEPLINNEQPFFDYDNWIKILEERYFRRKLMNASKNIHKLAKDEENQIDDVLHKSQEEIFSITNTNDVEEKIYTGEEALMATFDLFHEERENGKQSGTKTGFLTYDSKTGGLQKGHITVLAGQTSMGKTALALSIANNMLKEGKKILFISLEMNKTELIERLVVMNSNVKMRDYINRKINETQQKAINYAYNRMDNFDWTISDKRGLTVEDIKAIARKTKNQSGKFDAIFVDYLQRIRLPGKGSVNKETGTAVNQLRDLAGELDVPLVLLSQLNRSVEGRPKMKNLRDSGEIEEAADEVLFVYRPDYFKEEEEKDKFRQEAEIILAKGRTAGTGKFKMSFYPNITLWQDLVMEQYKSVEIPEILSYKG